MTNETSVPTPGSGHDYFKMLNETVNPANGSVSIRIGTPVPPGRGLTIPFSFSYDSSGVFVLGSNVGQGYWRSNTTFLSTGGWSYGVPLLSANEQTYTVFKYTCNRMTDYVFQGPSGDRHALGLKSQQFITNECGGTNISPSGDDLVRASLEGCHSPGFCMPVTVTNRDGTDFLFSDPALHGVAGGSFGASLPSEIEDRNGNQVSVTDSGGGAFTFTDELGRPAIISSGFGSSGDTVTISGLSGPYTVYWGSAGSAFDLHARNAEANTYCRGISGEGLTNPVVTAIKLPNGKEYQFLYDPVYGLLSQITYPSGGWIKYTWGLNGDSEFGSFPDTKGGTAGCGYNYDWPVVLHRYVSFNGSTVALQQDFTYSTTWKSPSTSWSQKVTTVTTTDKISGVVSQSVITYTPVSVTAPPDDSDAFGLQVPVESQTIYKNGTGSTLRTVNKTWKDQYLLGSAQTVLENGMSSQIAYTYDNNAQLTQKVETDYSGATRTTAITYQTGLTDLSGFSIDDRPSSVAISGANSAETDYSYNSHGDALTKTRKCSTGCLGNATTTYAYANNDGQVTQMTDPKGNPTPYTYTCSDTYLSKITYPGGLTENFTYDCPSGELTGSQDENGNWTLYHYVDSFNRLTEIDYPDTGKTTYAYNDTAPSPSVTIDKLLSSGAWANPSTTTMDGVGHVVKLTGEDSSKIDSNYDGDGQVRTRSNPYFSTSDPTYGITTYNYDALGRLASTSYPDGNAATISYTGNCATTTDSAAKTNKVCTDAFGRSTSDTDGLNNTTTYGYDALDNLTSVSQGGQSRTFVYNSLSELTSATNPESGVTSYTYDLDGNVATRTDARNITTTYAYDALNRLTSKTYNDTPQTPTAGFFYDETLVFD